MAGRHSLVADEPIRRRWTRFRPNPYDHPAIALGSCTAMTLRVYAEHKLALGRVSVAVRHGKIAVQHCSDCRAVAEGRKGKIDRFVRISP